MPRPVPDLRLAPGPAKAARDGIDLQALAEASDGFSGAEIEQAIVSALYAMHGAQSVLDTATLLQALRDTRPLSVLMAEQVGALRAWRCRARCLQIDPPACGRVPKAWVRGMRQ